MIDKSKYKRLRKRVKAALEEQNDSSFDSVQVWHFYGLMRDISDREIDVAWPHLMRDLSMVDDGTGTGTFARRGREFSVAKYVADAEARRARGTK